VGPWHETAASPRLDDRELFVPERHVRWIVDNSLPAAPLPEAMVELVGGDCVPGRATSFWDEELSGRRLPAHVEVALPVRIERPDGMPDTTVRISLTWLRRIVWQRVTDRYQPGTVFLLDGRQLDFRALRIGQQGVRLLRRDGIQEVGLSEMAELHMPAADPWEAYYQQLAALGPSPKAWVTRWETTWGLRVTSTTERFRALPRGEAQKPQNWLHALQPAWSLQPIWMPHESVRARQYFQQHEVPLSRIEPQERQRSLLGEVGWQHRTDRNVQGRPLESGGLLFPWGFGVHGQSDLAFPLPPLATAFRTRMGLDHAAGNGGCVRARVFLNAPTGSPAFSSPLLVGSQSAAIDSGRIALESPSPATRLVLQVDPALAEHPPGADPLDIRDVFDWLDPLVELDPQRLDAEVLRRGPKLIPSLANWKVVMGVDEAVRLASQWDGSDGPNSGYQLYTAVGNHPLHISSKLAVRPYRDQLVLLVNRPAGSGPSWIEARVAGLPVGQYEVPQRSSSGTPPLVVSLAAHHGQTVDVELIQESKGGRSLVEWQEIALVGRTDIPDLTKATKKWDRGSRRTDRPARQVRGK
jgi:hypothetical protein